jgi:5-methylcytosine-specific restriction endonuclease McrA
MISQLVEKIRSRSLRKQFIKDFPQCAACWTTKKLDVHHIWPLHSGGPDTYGNLMTLCKRCHTLIGHADNFKSWNEKVIEDAAYIRAMYVRTRQTLKEA